MPNQFRYLIPILLLGLIAAGCDQTADQFHQERLNRQLTLYQSVSGTYRGTLTIGGAAAADIEVYLHPDVTTTNASDGTSNAGKVIMQGHVTVTGATTSSAPIQNGYYYSSDNSTSGTFSGTIPVTLQNGVTETMTISGSISGKQMKGSIETSDLGETGEFTATLDASYPGGRQVQGDQSSFGAPGSVVTYQGSYTDTICRDPIPSCRVGVTMTTQVLEPQDGQDFYNNFAIEKQIMVQISTSEQVTRESDGEVFTITSNPISLSPVEWNTQTGHIESNQATGTGGHDVSINCDPLTSSTQKDALQCTYVAVGRVHRFIATPVVSDPGKQK